MMEFSSFRSFGRLTAMALVVFGSVLSVIGQTRIEFSVFRFIPDGEATGLSDQRTVTGVPGTITDLNVFLRIQPDPDGFAGDIYATLAHDSGFAVLLNRVGRRADGSPGAAFGYSDPGFNVKLDDAAANGDIHNYRVQLFGSHTGGSLSGPLTGTWAPDGRSADPSVVLDTSPRNASPLAAFNQLPANGT